MGTFLFNEIIFGPVISRRLGNSLGINLLPVDCKFCNFDCIYCECGWTLKEKTKKLLPAPEIEKALYKKLKSLKIKNIAIDNITFAGNGEPTLHPEFDTIIGFTRRLRDQFYQSAEIAVLSNSTMIHNDKVFNALQQVEKKILKLDSAIEETIKILNKPPVGFNVKDTVKKMKRFNGNFILQTMFVKGEFERKTFDNTSDDEVFAWLNMIKEIQPEQVMIYTIKRDTPMESVYPIPLHDLERIAKLVQETGIKVLVSD